VVVDSHFTTSLKGTYLEDNFNVYNCLVERLFNFVDLKQIKRGLVYTHYVKKQSKPPRLDKNPKQMQQHSSLNTLASGEYSQPIGRLDPQSGQVLK